jgi:UDP-hydrolysing UDP-N-acetyl-D-glucosamine 2-epimerase
MSTTPPWTVCIVSTSRADYGCLRRLMIEVRDDPQLRLSLVMIGRHWLSGELAYEPRVTVGQTEDGLPVALLVDADSKADDASSVGRALGSAVSQLADAIPRLAPQVVVILGDRYEIMAPALAALIHNVPVAHLHGGELSEGAIDDSIRHAVTKLAQLHFVSTEEYAARVRQMGEAPDTVFCVGAPALDGLASQKIMTRAELEQEIGLSLAEPVALVTYHPVTREPGSAGMQISNVLNAIQRCGIPAVFTVANADVAGREINAALAAQAVHPSRPGAILRLPEILRAHDRQFLQRHHRGTVVRIARRERREASGWADTGPERHRCWICRRRDSRRDHSGARAAVPRGSAGVPQSIRSVCRRP